ncbi:hypothetical protein T484DRAFT_1856716 [Baffinella frigidus]|nr:hypothetical protein T484DRAFT_1856716 [Cryptophyta sp. CCMP2293]
MRDLIRSGSAMLKRPWQGGKHATLEHRSSVLSVGDIKAAAAAKGGKHAVLEQERSRKRAQAGGDEEIEKIVGEAGGDEEIEKIVGEEGRSRKRAQAGGDEEIEKIVGEDDYGGRGAKKIRNGKEEGRRGGA